MKMSGNGCTLRSEWRRNLSAGGKIEQLQACGWHWKSRGVIARYGVKADEDTATVEAVLPREMSRQD